MFFRDMFLFFVFSFWATKENTQKPKDGNDTKIKTIMNKTHRFNNTFSFAWKYRTVV